VVAAAAAALQLILGSYSELQRLDVILHVTSKLRMVDIDEFHERKEAMELLEFQNICMRHIYAAKDKLMKKFVILC